MMADFRPNKERFGVFMLRFTFLIFLLILSEPSARIGYTVAQCDSNFLIEGRVSSSNLRDIPASKDGLPGTQDKLYYAEGGFHILCIFHEGVCKEIWYLCILESGCLNQELFEFLVGYINLPGEKLFYERYSAYTSEGACVAAQKVYRGIAAYGPLQACYIIDPDYSELLKARKSPQNSSK